jgi:hypothetical protein
VENFFKDNEDIQFQFEHFDWDWLVELREDHFKEKEAFAYAPQDVNDAVDNYKKVLDIIGQICAEQLAPYAAEIDEQGVKFENGQVFYPEAVTRVMNMFAKADLMGFCLPRQYGGLNMPTVVTSMAAEILSRADGSFLNFGLHQDNGMTVSKFASEELKEKYLPRFAAGEVESAMILTEPEAGSDLQKVSLRAHQGEDGKWYLNGVKRFITNGCAQMGLVLARSEEGSKGGRGLSFFLYERDEHMVVRRIENKLGIHGSATCELQFNNAPAELVGERKRGLSKYTMWLMNAARLGIAGQALGIAEASFREADKYAKERVQFGKPIRELTPVYEMLTEMKIAVEAGRTLYYETAKVVDIKEGLEEVVEKYPDRKNELRDEVKKYTKYASLLTPMVKAYNTEMANKVAYDAIQVHGGTGYMKEFSVERHARDARITNIYEGTTQLQIVAAIGGVMSGVAQELLNEFEEKDYSHVAELHKKVVKAKNMLEKTIAHVKSAEDQLLIDYHSRRLVEMTIDIIQAYLLMRDAAHAERKIKVAEVFIDKMIARVEMSMNFIINGEAVLLKDYQEIIGA